MTKLSDTARVLLSRASQHAERLAEPPKHLPAAARDAVVRSLLKNGLLAETPCLREHLALAWRQDEDGVQIAMQPWRTTVARLPRVIGKCQSTLKLMVQPGHRP